MALQMLPLLVLYVSGSISHCCVRDILQVTRVL